MTQPLARIEGLGRLETRLFQVAGALQNPVLRDAIEEGAELVRADAARRAPRGSTGKLQDEMTTLTETGTPERAATRVGPSANAWYGVFQEKGTKRQPARPFLRPALDTQGPAVVELVRKRLLAALQRKFRG